MTMAIIGVLFKVITRENIPFPEINSRDLLITKLWFQCVVGLIYIFVGNMLLGFASALIVFFNGTFKYI